MIEPAGTRHYQRRVNPDNRTPSGEFQFNVGVIGATGYIGAPYRAEIRQAAGANIVALCARRRELLERSGTGLGMLGLAAVLDQAGELGAAPRAHALFGQRGGRRGEPQRFVFSATRLPISPL